MIRAIRSVAARLYTILLVGVTLVAVFSLIVALPKYKTAAKQDRKPNPHTRRLPEHGPPTPQSIYAPIVDLPGSSGAELVLNNRSSHDMEVNITLYTRRGVPVPAVAVKLVPAEVRYIAVQDLIPVEYRGPSKMGGIIISYTGGMMEVAAQLTLLGQGKAGSVDVTFSAAMDYRSQAQEAVWWVPANGVATIILGNASDAPIEATLKRVSGQIETVQISPFGTEVVDYRSSRAGGVDSLSIETTGPMGSLRAAGLVRSQDNKFTSPIRFYDPHNIRQQHLFATNLRLQNTVPRMVLKNISNSQISATPKFLPATGDTGEAIELSAVNLKPNEAVEVNLEQLKTAALRRPELDLVSVQVVNGGPIGSLIGALSSTAQEGQTVYDVPLRDSGPVRNSTGSYPWRLDGDYTTIVSITNVGSEPAFLMVTIRYAGGQYLPPIKQLAVGETVFFNMNQLRNEQVPDKDGRLLPSKVQIGQFHWSALRAGGGIRFIGRGEMVSQSKNVSSSYSCPVCCPNSLSEIIGNPGNGVIPIGGFAPVRIDGIWVDCYVNIIGPYEYPSGVNWWRENPSVMSISWAGPGSSSYNCNGLSVGTSDTEASQTDVVYSDDGMDCYQNFFSFYDPGEATVFQVTFQKDNGDSLPTIFKVGITGGQGTSQIDRKQALRAVIQPAADANNVSISVSAKLQLSDVTRNGNIINFKVAGLTQSISKGDSFIYADHNTGGVIASKQVSVIVPGRVGTPHDTTGTLLIQNMALNISTRPAIINVGVSQVYLTTIYVRDLTIAVLDQFGVNADPLGNLYQGAIVEEQSNGSWHSINSPLSASGTYLDMVGTFKEKPTSPIVLATDTATINAWLAASPQGYTGTNSIPQNFLVRVDGFALNPAIANRTWQVSGTGGAPTVTITWP